MTPDQAWQDLLDKDDRTSPEEYPEMCLITREELAAYMLAASEVGQITGKADGYALAALDALDAWSGSLPTFRRPR